MYVKSFLVKECIVPHNRAESVISLFANQSIPIYAIVETCLDNYTMVSGDTAKLCFGGEWNGEILICQGNVTAYIGDHGLKIYKLHYNQKAQL